MKKLLMLKGLPGSGKSTYAKDLVNNQGYVRINNDELRAMLHNGQFSHENESLIVAARDALIKEAFHKGKSVVIDNTNFAPEHERTFRELAFAFQADFEIKIIDTPVETCIKRDAQRDKPVGMDVIYSMHNQYLRKP